ncbi:hypothetical protein CGZ80_24750 [Rhodopirellula sp. MGV]|nr:hypothetical protein CGZ80_24750 [Rhodopirellula sp. MGV]PNY35725.1 hypothetical protein C2E31_16705 [Rhodopirellula baltica]
MDFTQSEERFTHEIENHSFEYPTTLARIQKFRNVFRPAFYLVLEAFVGRSRPDWSARCVSGVPFAEDRNGLRIVIRVEPSRARFRDMEDETVARLSRPVEG